MTNKTVEQQDAKAARLYSSQSAGRHIFLERPITLVATSSIAPSFLWLHLLQS